MAIHEVTTLCPICNTVSLLGHADMVGNEDKHICPKCSARHYGEPNEVTIEDKCTMFICQQCKEKTSAHLWKRVRLSGNEKICGPIQWCENCVSKTEKNRVAFIELKEGKVGDENRTGRLCFMKPNRTFKKALKGARAVYIEESVLKKMLRE